MYNNDYEKAWDLFLETRSFDEAQNSFYSALKKAYEVGWLAAGGEKPIPHKIFEVLKGEQSDDGEPD